MKKIIIVGLSMILLLSLCISVTVNAEDPIKDSFYFSEDEQIILDGFIASVIEEKTEEGKGYTWDGKYVEVVMSFRCFTSHDADFIGKFSKGMSVQEVLASLPIYDGSLGETPAMFPGVTVIFQSDDEAWWSIGDYDSNYNGDSVVVTMGTFLMNSVEESIAQKNPEVDLETLEIQEVYCLDENRYRGGFYIFLFTNQGNYVFYQDHLYQDAISYFFTEEEFYEFIPTEYEKRNGGATQESPSLGNEDPTPSIDEPPIGEEPEKFDLRHLYWMIPTAVVIVGGAVGVVYWQVKKRKKIEE